MGSTRPPLGFMLVSQAATCEPSLASYQQIYDEERSGSLKIDPDLCHEGVWLLDHAIKMRLASRGGLRAFRAARGADPAMDALWARWLSSASSERLGSIADQAERIALLVQAGSSKCLDVALSLGIPKDLVREKWKEQKPSALRSEIMAECVRQDLLETARALLRHGYLDDRCVSKALLSVKKHDMLEMLLDFGADPSMVVAPGIIDGLLASEVSASELGRMMERLARIPGLSGASEDHLRRLSSKMGQKSLEQFRVEMRLAQWSPSSRGSLPSPVIAWARGQLEGAASASLGSPVLSWLAKQPSFSSPTEGESWSEAAWVWAALFAKHPQHAEEFAVCAKDMPAVEDPGERVAFFHRFTELNGLPRWVEDAIGGQLSDLSGIEVAKRASLVKKKLEGWIGDGSSGAFLGHFTTPARRAPDPTAWLKCLSAPGDEIPRAQAMTLACWMAFVQEDFRLLRDVEGAWESGARPLAGEAVILAFSGLLANKSGSLASKMGAWLLDHKAPQISPSLRQGPRL